MRNRIDPNFNPDRVLTYEQKEQMEVNKMQLYYNQEGLCATCGLPLDPSLYDAAHVIPKHKAWVRMYGWDVLDHIMNFRATHRNASCNDAVMISPKSRPVEAFDFVLTIQEEIENEKAY